MMRNPRRVLFVTCLCAVLFAIVLNVFAITLDLLRRDYQAAATQSVAAIFSTFAMWAIVSLDEWRQSVMTSVHTDVEFRQTMLDKIKHATVQRVDVEGDEDSGVRH